MKNSKINKRKINLIFYIKYFILLFLVCITIFFSIRFYQSGIIKTKIITIIENLSIKYEYSLNEIQVEGLKNLSFNKIDKYFKDYYGKSIFLVPLNDIAKEIVRNNWVENVKVKNDYKKQIKVILTESVPIGIYSGNKNMLFDKNGKIIDFINTKDKYYLNLIKFKGKYSIINANLLITNLPPSIIKEIEEAYYISERRWNLKMKNGLNLKLAENNVSESINNYIKIYKKITNDELQNIESIDLRIKNKAIIKFIERDND